MRTLKNRHISRFNESENWNTINPTDNNPHPFGKPKPNLKESKFIKHYFINQQMEVRDLVRKEGNGKEFIINDVGIIEKILDGGNGDVKYVVRFNKTTTFPDGSSSPTTGIYISHNEDKENIVRVW